MRRLPLVAATVAATIALSLAATLSLTACGGGGSGEPATPPGAAGASSPGGSQSSAQQPSTPQPGGAAIVVITPAMNTANVDPAAQISVSVAHGKLTSVTAQLSGGAAVTGVLAADSSSWTSNGPVGVGHAYGVTAVATGGDGKAQTVTSTFSTAQPASLFVGSYQPENGSTVGVAQPVSITFDKPIADQAAVEQQLTVTAEPAVSGSWHWFGSQRVDYRPQQYWAPGTKVSLKLRLDGVKSGSAYGKQNRDVTFTVGRSLVATMDVNTHMMTVVSAGKTTTLPVSSGKPGFETWNGTMVVLDKQQDIRMDSTTVGIFGVNAYDIPDVYWDVRLTPSGTFVHAAPWNAGKFGHVNGSHGCVGMSTADAQWFYNQVITGDPVTVVNSKDTVRADNGYGDWNLSWPDWTAGSATRH
jgi:lipoprotein-anchoring transpeptidase ErfK/SrfK